jgi:hypothetical protein
VCCKVAVLLNNSGKLASGQGVSAPAQSLARTPRHGPQRPKGWPWLWRNGSTTRPRG